MESFLSKALPQNNFIKTVFTQFLISMPLQLHAKKQKSSMRLFCYRKKTHFGPVFVQIFLCKAFPGKIIWVNFKPLRCCNFTEKIRKIQSIRFSQNLNNLILGSFWLPFGPKTSEQRFSQKITLFSFKSNLIQRIENVSYINFL